MGAIVWLASYPKSGNTWLRAFLHNLLRDPAQPVDINQLDRFTHSDTLRHWYAAASPRPLDELTPQEIAQLRPLVHRKLTETYPDSVFVKTHNLLGDNLGVSLITMECTAGAIYVVRDPRDVAISLADHFGIGIDDAIAMLGNPAGGAAADAINVAQVYGTWSMHVQSWTQRPSPQLHVLRYEDMTEAPLATFKAVAAFLGLQPPRARLEKAIKFSSFKVLQGQERRHGFKERSDKSAAFFRAGRAGQWKTALTAAQAEAIAAAHGEQMRRFGYL
jgi:Sulfotransferase domain